MQSAEVIQRLRESKRQQDESDRTEAKSCGAEWAQQHADFNTLKRLAIWEEKRTVYSGVSEACIIIADSFEGGDTGAVDEMWEEAANTSEPSDEFVEWFVEGALEVFREVEQAL